MGGSSSFFDSAQHDRDHLLSEHVTTAKYSISFASSSVNISLHHISYPSPPTSPQPLSVVVPNINDRLLKLPRRNLPLEQNVQFSITPPFQLRQPKVPSNKTHRRSPSPNIPTLTRKVQPSRIQHHTREINHRNLSDVIRSSSNTRRQSTKSYGRCFGDDGIRNRSQRAGVDERD